MKRAFYIIGGLTLAISIPSALQAQTTQPKDTTMNRTVVVEQEYNPDIMDASKVNVLPKVEEPTVSKKNVEYATTFFPAMTRLVSRMTASRICACRLWQLRQSRCTRQLFILLV